jgi:hypothetical protein
MKQFSNLIIQQMKHAYLIIAHNEFEVLQKLITALDDARNDIYVMIDKKVSKFPTLSCRHSKLFVLNNRQRIAIYWGHVSQIKAELALFHVACENGSYQYYHIISGTHLPLKSQNFIHDFFDLHQGKQILQPIASSHYDTNMKTKRAHFFLKCFNHQNKNISRIAQVMWRRAIMLQSFLKLKKNQEYSFIKAANWVSVTHDGVVFLLERKNQILKKYARTFCGDEFFIPSELAQSPFAETCFFFPRLIYSKIEKSSAMVIRSEDCEKLLKTDFLFARKFSASNMESVNMVLEYLKTIQQFNNSTIQ